MITIPLPAPSQPAVQRAESISLNLPSAPLRYYRHGWQSWSLAAWTAPGPLPVPKPAILHPLQVDPRHVRDIMPNGSWVGAAELADGQICLLGALGLDAHVRLEGQALKGRCESGEVEWLAACGPEDEVFAAYTSLLGQRLGKVTPKPAPRVWCSWYSFYTAIDEARMDRAFTGLDGLPFDVLQVDDGWQASIGDWTVNSKFPAGMPALAERIRRTGRTAGLWLAPLIAQKSSQLYRQNPGWFLHDAQGRPVSAGFNWGEQLYALDTTLPEVQDWLTALMRQVRAWGFDYLKLDFLYGGALQGARSQPIPGEEALRQALLTMRQAMGEDAYFLTCGVPVLPAVGACDAMRAGPDVAGEWEVHRDAHLFSNPATPAGRNAVRTFISRLWLQPLLRLDPDVAYFAHAGCSLTPQQMYLLQQMAHIAGFKATSDLPQQLTPQERQSLAAFLEAEPQVTRLDRSTFMIGGKKVDFSPEMDLPPAAQGLEGAWAQALAWLASQPAVLKLYKKMGDAALRRRLAGIPGL